MCTVAASADQRESAKRRPGHKHTESSFASPVGFQSPLAGPSLATLIMTRQFSRTYNSYLIWKGQQNVWGCLVVASKQKRVTSNAVFVQGTRRTSRRMRG